MSSTTRPPSTVDNHIHPLRCVHSGFAVVIFEWRYLVETSSSVHFYLTSSGNIQSVWTEWIGTIDGRKRSDRPSQRNYPSECLTCGSLHCAGDKRQHIRIDDLQNTGSHQMESNAAEMISIFCSKKCRKRKQHFYSK